MIPLLLVVVAALPPVPAPSVVTPDEEARLAAREIILRSASEATDNKFMVLLDVQASIEKTIAATVDLPPRTVEVTGIKAIDIYEQSPGRVSGRFVTGRYGYTATFSTTYEYDLSRGWCVFHLDPTAENSVQFVDGSYHAYDIGGRTRLVYSGWDDIAGWLPDWVRTRLLTGTAIEMFEGIRSRAERG